jgi:hypothetical protein
MRRSIESQSAEAALVRLQDALQPVHFGIARIAVHREAVVGVTLAADFRAKTIYLEATIKVSSWDTGKAKARRAQRAHKRQRTTKQNATKKSCRRAQGSDRS